jgi:hypothetical protein
LQAGEFNHALRAFGGRDFELRFAKDRDGYRRRLLEAVWSVNASLLTYNITSNHVHLLIYADHPEQIATAS